MAQRGLLKPAFANLLEQIHVDPHSGIESGKGAVIQQLLGCQTCPSTHLINILPCHLPIPPFSCLCHYLVLPSITLCSFHLPSHLTCVSEFRWLLQLSEESSKGLPNGVPVEHESVHCLS